MSVRFILGRGGVGKTTTIQREIVEKVKADPFGPPIYVIVPDQLSYSMEETLTVRSGLGSLVRVHVLSFKRLAWTLLQEVGGATKQQIDPYGYTMLIRQVLREVEEDFTLFKRAVDKRGFVDQMVQLLQEMSRYRVDSEKLYTFHQHLIEEEAHPTIIQKVEEIAHVAKRLEERLGTTYIDSEGPLHLLSERMERSTTLQNATVYIDSFEKMTASEFDIVEQLFAYAKEVVIALPHDVRDDANDLFFSANRLYEALLAAAHRQHAIVETPLYLERSVRYVSPSLRHLEQTFDQYRTTRHDIKDEGLHIIRAEDRRAEIEAVARHIRTLAKEGVRYREMVIVYQQDDYYDELLTRYMQEYDIPLFISQRRSMMHHPLIEFVRAALDVIARNWSYTSVFRAVKTDLLFPLEEGTLQTWREKADRLENFVLAKGIRGSDWVNIEEREQHRWTYRKYRGLSDIRPTQTDEELAYEAMLHEVREVIRLPLLQLMNRMKEEKTGRGKAFALYECIETLRIQDKLANLQKKDEREGKLERAKEHEQAWNAFVHLLDQFVVMFGEEPMTLQQMIDVLDEGLAALEFNQIPPALDQVTVTTFAGGSFLNPRVAFLIGMNDGVIPARSEQEGLLTDRDRSYFERAEVMIAPSTADQIMADHYYAYRAFTAPTERLYVSYALSDAEGKGMQPSYYVSRLEERFVNIPKEKATHTIVGMPDEEAIAYVTTPFATLKYFIEQFKAESENIAYRTPLWEAVKQYYRTNKDWSHIYEEFVEPVTHRHETERLDRSIVNEIYGQTLKGSVSRIEMFHSCPFRYYATYGLQLEERSVYELTPPSIGDLFHATFEALEYRLKQMNLRWEALTDEQIRQLSIEVIDELSPSFVHRILLSSARFRYIQRRLTQIIIETARAVKKQAAQSSFRPVGVELGFGGKGDPLPPLQLPLVRHPDYSIALRGRIDRVDLAEEGEKAYVRIVDYKSSKQSLDLTSVYYGLSLQMLTYLDVVIRFAPSWLQKEVQPAGMFYMHVHKPMLTLEEEVKEEELKLQLLESYRLGGYALEETRVIEALDNEAPIGQKYRSPIVPIEVTKSGYHKRNSKLLTTEQIDNLRKWTEEKHIEAGDQIVEGCTDVAPYELGNHMPCTYCPHQAVCQFDKTDPQYEVRKLHHLKDEEVLQRMQKYDDEEGMEER